MKNNEKNKLYKNNEKTNYRKIMKKKYYIHI